MYEKDFKQIFNYAKSFSLYVPSIIFYKHSYVRGKCEKLLENDES